MEVLRQGSFIRAARRLRISPPSATRLFKAFERRFGHQLALRSPTQLELLPFGSVVYSRSEALVREMDALLRMSVDSESASRVRLTIACSVEVARAVVQTGLDEFLKGNSGVEVELLTGGTEGNGELRQAHLTLCLASHVEGRSAVVRPLGEERLVFVAAPSANASRPASYSQLAETRFLWVGERAQAARWLVSHRRTHWEEVELAATLADMDAFFVLEAVRKGLGVGILPTWLVADAMRQGQLVRAFRGWSVAPAQSPRALFAYTDSVSPHPAALRRLVDYVQERWAAGAESTRAAPIPRRVPKAAEPDTRKGR